MVGFLLFFDARVCFFSGFKVHRCLLHGWDLCMGIEAFCFTVTHVNQCLMGVKCCGDLEPHVDYLSQYCDLYLDT